MPSVSITITQARIIRALLEQGEAQPSYAIARAMTLAPSTQSDPTELFFALKYLEKVAIIGKTKREVDIPTGRGGTKKSIRNVWYLTHKGLRMSRGEEELYVLYPNASWIVWVNLLFPMLIGVVISYATSTFLFLALGSFAGVSRALYTAYGKRVVYKPNLIL